MAGAMALLCPQCESRYTSSGRHQPRLLVACGHTFCQMCVNGLKESGTAFCPQCKAPINSPHVPNVSLIELVDSQKPSSPRSSCQYCDKEVAILICFQCHPVGVKFCQLCSDKEHVGPIRSKHKPKSLSQTLSPAATVPNCPRHPSVPSQLFSLEAKQFACEFCASAPGFDASAFMAVKSAMQHVSSRLPGLIQRLTCQAGEIERTGEALDQAIHVLDSEKYKTLDEVKSTFAGLEQALKRRCDAVMNNVEQEAHARRKLLVEQQERVEVERGSLGTSIAQASMLQQRMHDYSQLQQVVSLMEKMERQLLQVDPSLNKGPVMTGSVSCFIAPDFVSEIEKLGIVGGANTPRDFTCCHDKGLLLLKWQVPESCSGNSGKTVQKYEIECEQVEQSLSLGANSSNGVPGDGNKVLSVEVDATAEQMQKHLVHGTVPGAKYSFRIRSLGAAGWGCWSHPLEIVFQDLPLEVGYTGEIVKLAVPRDGDYHIVARGASAESGKNYCRGGRGAIISAKFYLKAGDILEILCGGKSTRRDHEPSSGGGGGTFVALSSRANLLLAAGGGGGTRGHDQDDQDGRDANIGEEGLAGVGREWAPGGVGGSCGKDAIFTGPPWGHGGAGFNQASSTAKSFVHGGAGGPGGGFGGGGGVGTYGGGGGGGYSGGGGGRGGGGGGSYVREDGTDVRKMVGNEGDGTVKIDYC